MAYDEALAQRVRSLVAGQSAGPVSEQRMFGGLAFLIAGNMAVVVRGRGGLMVRVDPDRTDALLREPGTDVMQMRGRPTRGWLTVGADAVTGQSDLRRWVKRGVNFATTLPPKHR